MGVLKALETSENLSTYKTKTSALYLVKDNKMQFKDYSSYVKRISYEPI